MKNKFSIAMSLAVVLAMLLTSLALAAELVTAEVTGAANDVTVTQGTSATSTINLLATGSISCSITSANASTATVDTSYSLNSAGALTTGSPSSAFKFYSDGVPQGGSGNCGVTWDTASTPYSVTATFSAAATTPIGDYTVSLQDSSAGTTDTADVTNPSVSGGKLGDSTPTTITVHVIAPIVIDSTPPIITSNIIGTLGNDGWYTSDVTVSWSVTDNESTISSSSGCGSTTINTDTAGTTLTCTATSAGGTNSQSVTIKRDATAPTISGSASPAANGADWNNTDVSVSFICGDNLSGVASCGPDQTLSSEGAGQSVTGNVSDSAGNTNSTTVSGINIDKTAPTVSLVGGPADGASYYFGSVPAAPSCSASDALSGLAGTCSVSGYGTAVGSHTVSASATDQAGNSASASATYTVLAWTLNGFYQPVDMNGVYNTVRGGSTVPLKFEVFAGLTELTATSVVQSFVQTRIACDGTSPTDEIEVVTTGGTSLRYDATSGQFIQNWQTPRAAGFCYRVTMTTQDGSSLVAFFKLK
jgi:hypothetical protein